MRLSFKRIVLWIPQGRLGNMLFQYQAAQYFFSRQSLIYSVDDYGFQNIIVKENNINFIKFSRVLVKLRVVEFIKFFLLLLAKARIISSILQDIDVWNGYPIETSRSVEKIGLLAFIWVFKGYFQSENFSLNKPRIRVSLLEAAEKKLAHIPVHRRVALHMRFTDYEGLEVLGKVGAILPDDYYKNGINFFLLKIKRPIFIIFSDDRRRSKSMLKDLGNYEFYEGDSEYDDFSAITLCSHALISASSFSWWGAYLIGNNEPLIYAPKYWLGFKSKIWNPEGIQTKSFNYIEL
jgi:hypothetical protein